MRSWLGSSRTRMSSPVFLDANIPIYAAGRTHPLKEPAARLVALVADHPDAFVTDVEVVQELLHRYLALRLWDAGRAVVEQFLALMEGHIEPLVVSDVQQAVELANRHTDISARDLVHAAVMQRLGLARIVTADADFGRIEGIELLDLARLDSWVSSIAP